MDFGQALKHLKNGKRLTRAGWNGKGAFIYLDPGSASAEDRAKMAFSFPTGERDAIGREVYAITVNSVSIDLFELGDEDTVLRMPCINMRTSNGAVVTGWLASQTDMLAEDWILV